MYTQFILTREPFFSKESKQLASLVEDKHFFGKRGALSLAEEYFEKGVSRVWTHKFCDTVAELITVLYLAAHHKFMSEDFFGNWDARSLINRAVDLSFSLRDQPNARHLKSYQRYTLILVGGLYLQIYKGVDYFGLLKRRKNDVKWNLEVDIAALEAVLVEEQRFGLHMHPINEYDSRQYLLLAQSLTLKLSEMDLYVLLRYESMAEYFFYVGDSEVMDIRQSRFFIPGDLPTRDIRSSAENYIMRHEKSKNEVTLAVIAELSYLMGDISKANHFIQCYNLLTSKGEPSEVPTFPPLPY